MSMSDSEIREALEDMLKMAVKLLAEGMTTIAKIAHEDLGIDINRDTVAGMVAYSAISEMSDAPKSKVKQGFDLLLPEAYKVLGLEESKDAELQAQVAELHGDIDKEAMTSKRVDLGEDL